MLVSLERFKQIVESLNSSMAKMGIETGGGFVVFFHPNQKENMRQMLELTEEQFNERVFWCVNTDSNGINLNGIEREGRSP